MNVRNERAASDISPVVSDDDRDEYVGEEGGTENLEHESDPSKRTDNEKCRDNGARNERPDPRRAGIK